MSDGVDDTSEFEAYPDEGAPNTRARGRDRPMARETFRIDAVEIARAQRLVRRDVYPSRSEVYRAAIREFIEDVESRHEWEPIRELEIAAVLSESKRGSDD